MVGSGRVGSLWPPPPLSGQPWFISPRDSRRCQGLHAAVCSLGSHRGSSLPLAFEPLGTTLCGGDGVCSLDLANHSLILGLEVGSAPGTAG